MGPVAAPQDLPIRTDENIVSLAELPPATININSSTVDDLPPANNMAVDISSIIANQVRLEVQRALATSHIHQSN